MFIFLLIAGGALLYFGGESLVRGSAGLALRSGLSPLVIGLTVVAFGTSMPELAVSLDAALKGSGSLSLGNIVGSNICNVGLIVGVSALIRPIVVDHRLVRTDIPLVLLVSMIAVVTIGLDGVFGPIEGLIFFSALVIWVVWSVRTVSTEKEPEVPEEDRPPQRRFAFCLLQVALGLVLLVGGAELFVVGAVDLASRLGVSEAAIGLTVVAIGTSLPELATSVVAATRGQSEIAIGNAVGSNLFNLLGILGITGMAMPLDVGGVTLGDLLIMLGISALLFLFARSRLRIHRHEGALLLAGYVAYVIWTL